MAELTEWLRIMLDEIARKSEERKRAATEEQQRTAENASQQPNPPAG